MEVVGDDLNYLKSYAKVLRAFNAWPTYKDEQNFKVFAAIKSPFYILVGVSAMYHLFYNLFRGCKLPLDIITEDIYLVLVTSFAEYLILFAIFRQEKILNVMHIVGNFSTFGTPKNANEVDKSLTKYLKIFVGYSFIVGFTYFITSFLLKEDFNLGERCGDLPYIMLPFKVDFLPIDAIYSLLLGISTIYMYSICGTTFLTFYACLKMTILKVEHLQELIEHSFESNTTLQRKQNFTFCIKYHIYIIRTVKIINECYSRSLLVLMSVMATFIGLDGYMFLQMHNYKYLGHMSSNLTAVFIICMICQNLINKSEDITQEIFKTTWYRQPAALQKDVYFMLFNAQRDLSINADGFSIISNATFSYVLNTTFSILAFLNSSMQKQNKNSFNNI